MQTPYVGILVNDKLFRSIPIGKTQYEAVKQYVKAGEALGFIPCFFRIRDLRAGQSTVRAYVHVNGKHFARRTVPTPKVIHNRAIYLGKQPYYKLRSWVSSGIQLFNRWNRYGKLHIQEVLMDEPTLRPHLPSTYEASASTIRIMMKLYDDLIIKPNKSSIGLGVMKLQRTATGWKLTYPISTGPYKQIWRNLYFRGPALPALLKRRIKRERYIVQQRLPLATFEGRPFDLRVSVQRDATGEWQITGIVAKVASKKSFLTNVAQGGSVYQLEHILQTEYPQLNEDEVFKGICDFSLRTASHLGLALPHMADLGLDVGITDEGFPMFIECNGKDQRYSFREAGMLDQWKATYFNPMAYAKYLLDNNKAAPGDS